jgi:hypothetical protein
MHFYMHSYLHKIFILVKSGCYTRTQPRSKTKTWDTYQKVGELVEHAVKVLLCGCVTPRVMATLITVIRTLTCIKSMV